jgi:hypothetical protein
MKNLRKSLTIAMMVVACAANTGFANPTPGTPPPPDTVPPGAPINEYLIVLAVAILLFGIYKIYFSNPQKA